MLSESVTFKLPSSTGTLYIPKRDGEVIDRIKLVNMDAGTAYSTINVYLKKRGQDAVPLTAYNYQLMAGYPAEIDGIPPLNVGDEITGDATLGTDVRGTMR